MLRRDVFMYQVWFDPSKMMPGKRKYRFLVEDEDGKHIYTTSFAKDADDKRPAIAFDKALDASLLCDLASLKENPLAGLNIYSKRTGNYFLAQSGFIWAVGIPDEVVESWMKRVQEYVDQMATPIIRECFEEAVKKERDFLDYYLRLESPVFDHEIKAEQREIPFCHPRRRW